MAEDERGVGSEKTADDVVLIRVRGSLDGWSGSGDLSTALTGAVTDGGVRTVVDLSGVTFADSAALHSLLDGLREHMKAGVPLVLAGPLHSGVRRLFEVTGTAGAFRFADDVESALQC
ncbi:STAS domain-containing protein [Streptomyces sp. CB02460]|uniref:STAS domain-containing protein n=1 Tax=Streptomyces sp. CB02460 TaxID=1703941 RepID=UPI00093B179F|nr:STAS domain-containing protein [Streptomyces sp. CB02460]OKJ72823.1 anti-anti-sigma factor [Streptomyces sp. CB02460]